MEKILEDQIVRSALWAAYGDAVGFPTELVSKEQFKSNHSLIEMGEPMPWKRRVGGIFGAVVEFPSGTYSDDTQLRLSTCRSIRGDGFFDVESFAKIELPVWLSYALGAGRGSKLAATNLASKETTWFFNFYKNSDLSYCNGGGNGAAMRIQPHVWQGHRHGPKAFMPDVIRNSVCTHGHPRAILGAAIHSLMLFEALHGGRSMEPASWSDIGEAAASVAYDALLEDEELSSIWIPKWELTTKIKLADAWTETLKEWCEASKSAAIVCSDISMERHRIYEAVIERLGGFSSAERGSGLKTPLFAAVLAWLYRNEEPELALQVAANTFNSDTDTIGTMAGALIGAVCYRGPHAKIQDAEYIKKEAVRLFRCGEGLKQASFEYPDLLAWTAPKNQSSAWLESKSGPVLMGLGEMSEVSEPYRSPKASDSVWQWCRLDFGQTVLVKRRLNRSPNRDIERVKIDLSNLAQRSLPAFSVSQQASLGKNSSIDEHSQFCIRANFDAKTIGESLNTLAQGPQGIEKAIAFAAIIAKAKIARAK